MNKAPSRTSAVRVASAILGLILVLTGACEGTIGGRGQTGAPSGDRIDPKGPQASTPPRLPAPVDPPAAEADPGAPVMIPTSAPQNDGVAPAFIRRLTTRELSNAFQTLFGYRPPSLAQVPRDGTGHLFDRVVQGETVTLAHLEAFVTVADELADWLTPQRLGNLVPACATSTTLPEDGAALARNRRPCIEKLIDDLGARALRRVAVDPAKRAALLALYDAPGTYAEGLRQVVHGIVGAVEFLYVIELGAPVAGKPGVFALSDMEIATRLSLFLCEDVPASDPELLAAARNQQLRQPDQIAAHAARFMDKPCAKSTVAKFFTEWFEADKLATVPRDPKLYPMFTDRARASLVREQEEFSKHVTFEQNGKLADLFTANFSFLTRDSAAIYGLTSTATAPQLTTLPAQRRGLLTQPAILTLTSPSDTKTSPVIRAKFVLEELVCRPVPPPPANMMTKPDDGSVTARASAEKHAADPTCAACHNVLDPVGFSLEDFNPIGMYRTTDRGMPVNATGGIPSLGVPNGSVKGGAELSVALSRLKELRECFAKQWFRFGMARLEGQADVKSLWELTEQGVKEDSLRNVMLGLVRTYAFRHRAVAP